VTFEIFVVACFAKLSCFEWSPPRPTFEDLAACVAAAEKEKAKALPVLEAVIGPAADAYSGCRRARHKIRSNWT